MSDHRKVRRAHATCVGGTAAALTALLLVSVVGAVSATTRAGGSVAADSDAWRPVLLRAAEAAQRRRYIGEALTIVWSDGRAQVSLSRVGRDHDTLTVSSADRFTMHLGQEGGHMVDHRQGWLAPLPAADTGRPEDAVNALERKYEVALAGEERLLDRPSTRLDVHRRVDGSLRERLWVDDDSGLVLRRESFEGADQRLRLMAYLSLDLRGGPVARATDRTTRGQPSERLHRRSQEVSAVDGTSLSALRRAGWTVPPELPGGYEPVGVYAVDGADGQPLQVVYRDGLYVMSLFQQRGRPDWASLPDGAQPAEGLDWSAYEWPGAVPRRLVWEASGTTFSLVGDAPPEEFMAIAESLPRQESHSLAQRLRRGLGRLLPWTAQ